MKTEEIQPSPSIHLYLLPDPRCKEKKSPSHHTFPLRHYLVRAMGKGAMNTHACVCIYAWGTEGVLRNTEESVHETVEVGLGQLWADGKLRTQERADWYYSVSLKCLRHRDKHMAIV